MRGVSRPQHDAAVGASRFEQNPEAFFFGRRGGRPRRLRRGAAVTALLVRGGRVVDPGLGLDAEADILARDGRVVGVGRVAAPGSARVIDAAGLVVAPGLIDVHVHLREPGFSGKETIATGTAAAAAGGFTTVFCMPNTEPALDSVAVLTELRRRIEREGSVRVHPIAAITKGRRGEAPVDYDALVAAGAVGFSDDGDTTADSGIMRLALEATRGHRRPVMVHCEDRALARGAMHEGDISRQFGIPGIPSEAEEIVIARDVALARLTGGWLHVCHVSIGAGADLVRAAKAAGTGVTAEVAPHHLLMSDAWVGGSRRLLNVSEPAGEEAAPADPNTKVNPPLRSETDTRHLLAALRNGTIDLVATDHAPHRDEEKSGTSFASAAFGLSGSEFALPLMLGLVRAGHLTLSDLIAKMSLVPARLWRLPAGTLAPGTPADLVLFDPDEEWTVDRTRLRSKGGNTPLLGMKLRGRVKRTFVGGEERYVD